MRNMNEMTLTPELLELINVLIRVQNDQKATVFFGLAGHVSEFTIKLFKGGWVTDSEPSYNNYVYIERNDEVLSFIENTLAYIKTLYV